MCDMYLKNKNIECVPWYNIINTDQLLRSKNKLQTRFQQTKEELVTANAPEILVKEWEGYLLRLNSWMILLVLSSTLIGCSKTSYELPERMGIPVPGESWDGTRWFVEADKMSGELNQLYIGESSDRKGYKVGDEIRIKGNDFIVEAIEAKEKPIIVWLKRAD